MKIDIVDCFTTDVENSGNRAAVITDFDNEEIDKQLVAALLNLPVTVFVSNLDADMPLIEYFYPKAEMPLCLHGTIAAGYVVSNRKDVIHFNFITKQSYLLDLYRDGNTITVTVSVKETSEMDFDSLYVCKMLGLSNATCLSDLYPLAVASVGSPKLLVPLKSRDFLMRLSPDYNLIREWSLINGINGLYVFSPADYLEDHCDFIARGFNPKTGCNEDAATGVASAALAAYLRRSIIIKQGESIGRSCRIINTYLDHDHIFIGGEAKQILTDRYTNMLSSSTMSFSNPKNMRELTIATAFFEPIPKDI